MLYDPKWERQPSVAGFRAWLERQDLNETFEYVDCKRCAAGQYLASVGTNWWEADGEVTRTINGFAYRAVLANRTECPTFAMVLREMDLNRSFLDALSA